MENKVLYDLSYGVYLTTTMDKDRPVGCVTNSVMQITSAPMTLAVSVNHDNYTNGCIKESGLFAVDLGRRQRSFFDRYFWLSKQQGCR